jgi:4'-phosphopantetheinyl transferase
MIKIAICNVKDLELEKAIKKVSKKRREKVSKYRFLKDKKLSCGAQLLLNKMLSEEDISSPEYAEDYYHKPYIINHEIEFNISHSKEMVACALSDKNVGIDIEYVDKNIDLNIAKHYFYDGEYEKITKSPDKEDEFFKYWVLKESFMKYTSLGFNLELNEFNINIEYEDINVLLKNKDKTLNQMRKNNNRSIDLDNLKLKLYNLEDYKLAITSLEEVSKFKVYDVKELY